MDLSFTYMSDLPVHIYIAFKQSLSLQFPLVMCQIQICTPVHFERPRQVGRLLKRNDKTHFKIGCVNETLDFLVEVAIWPKLR